MFVLLRVVPGDPIAMLIGPGATEQDIANLRRLYGLDESIVLQFVYYLRDLASGDFGTSISMRQDVMELVLGRLPVTIELCLVAMLISTGLGGAMALTGAYWRGRFGEVAVDAAAGFILANPGFPVGAAVHPVRRCLRPRTVCRFPAGSATRSPSRARPVSG